MDDLARFRAVVLEDPGLQSLLLAESEIDGFVDLLVRLAAERGFDITPAEVRWALHNARAGTIDGWTA